MTLISRTLRMNHTHTQRRTKTYRLQTVWQFICYARLVYILLIIFTFFSLSKICIFIKISPVYGNEIVSINRMPPAKINFFFHNHWQKKYAWFHSSMCLLLLFGKVRVFSSSCIHLSYIIMYLLFACKQSSNSNNEPKKSVKKKYWWNLWLQSETNYYATTSQLHMHCTENASHSNDIAIAACKFGHINGVSVLCCHSSIRHVFWVFNISRFCSQLKSVIIFDNFSDKKITLDKLL